MDSSWPRQPTDPISKTLVPTLYGSVPTAFGAPLAESASDLKGADLAFLGIPWSAPPSSGRSGLAAAAFAGTVLTPNAFRANSIKYGGYLPELDVDVFQSFKLVDYGNVDVAFDLNATFTTVEQKITEILAAGCIPITVGGNAGPSTYPVVKAIADHAGGDVAVVNLDAHGDNHIETPEERNSLRNPRWGSTWAMRILELPQVKPSRYIHVGLRGPRNDRGTITRFTERGVPRSQIYTYAEIEQARLTGFNDFAAEIVSRCEGAAKVWLAIDPDVLDMSVCPQYGDEPLGITVNELVAIARAVGRHAGRRRFGGVAMMAIPPEAHTLQWICMYAVIYALAGVLEHEQTK